MATFQDWLAQNGYRYQEGDDASYIFTPDGQRISANNNDATYAQLQNQFQLSQQYANPDIWGTMGSYYGGLSNVGSDGGEGIGGFGTAAGPDGYVRTGPAENSRFDAFGGGYQYDPTYGWIVPSSTASAYGDSHDDSMNYFLAALGGVAAPYAASLGLIGPGAGVVGAQGSAFPSVGMELGSAGLTGGSAVGGAGNILNGMDLSQYMTGVDDFSYSTLTNATEGAAGAGSYAVDPALGAQQAIDGSMQSIYDANAAAGMSGYSPSLASSAAGSLGGSSFPLANILSGSGSLPDWLKLGGSLLNTGLGMYSANQQANAYEDKFNKMFGAGAPARDLFYGTFAPGFDLSKDPALRSAMDTSMNTYMRAASAGNAQGVAGGNPFNNPGAFMESQKYLLGSVGLPYLMNTRNTLANAGGLGLNQSVPFGQGQIQSQGAMWGDLGYGLRDILGGGIKGGDYVIPEVGPRFRLPTGATL
jgi:hypothetical protein